MTYRSLALLTLASLSLIGASRPLNPLVVRRANPTAVVDCNAALSPPPRAVPAAIAPPTGALRDVLREAQAALERNDRAAFDASLARARELARDARQIRVWEDVARLWDAQFESPFFASGSPAHAAASAYPGYDAAVRRDLLVDDRGQRFYPAAESREFLARIAASRVGASRRVPTKIRVDEAEDSGRALQRVAARRPARSSARRASRARTSPPSRVAPAPSPVPAPAAASDTAAVTDVPAPAIVAPTPPPVVASDPTSTEPTIPATPAPKRNLMLPLVVILVGIGMLILLFRTK